MIGNLKSSVKRWAACAAAAAAICLLPLRTASADTFPAKSLIIPTQASFQTPCGMVSAYGLVFQTLRANPWLADHGHSKVTIHWAIKPGKTSPNRCSPSNLIGPSSVSPTPLWNDPSWNQGCDFVVQNSAAVPVSLISNGSPAEANDSFNFATYDTNGTGYPRYRNSDHIRHTISAATNVTDVQYMGGVFIIHAGDADTFLKLISNQITAYPLDPNATTTAYGTSQVDFSAFTQNQDTCNFSGGQFQWDNANGVVNDSSNPSAPWASTHYVNIHRAQVSFDAPDTHKINATPSRIAVLRDSGGLTSTSTSGNQNGVIGDMLPKYLKSAGLNFTGAIGCPKNAFNSLNLLRCPNGPNHGEIFDAIDTMDLASATADPLNHPLTPGDTYTSAWFPHWTGQTFTGCDSACIGRIAANIFAYVDAPNQRGVVAECASIGVFEGQVYASDIVGQQAFSAYAARTQGILSCASSNGTNCNAGAAASVLGSHGIVHRESPAWTGNTFMKLQNCTDPNMGNVSSSPFNSSSTCVHHPNADNTFAQIGDYIWTSTVGFLGDYSPNPNAAERSIYRPEALPLVFSIRSVDTSNLTPASAARAQAGADNVTFIQRDGNPLKGRIIYLGGHTYSALVAGTRIVLNTLLALAFVPPGVETAYVGPTSYGNIAFVPTYDEVTTVGPPDSWLNYTSGQQSQWQFPYRTGHMRGIAADSLANTSGAATDFSAATGAYTVSDAKDVLRATSPNSRNLFTYLGGKVTANPSLGAGKTAPNSVLQTGWTPVDIDYTAMNTGCVDNFKISQVCGVGCIGSATATKTTYAGAPYAGMVAGADGVCDIQQALQTTPLNLGSDYGFSEQAANVTAQQAAAAVREAKELLQMVRGYCYITDTHNDGTGNFVAHDDSGNGLDPVNVTTQGHCNVNSGKSVIDFAPNTNLAKLGALVKSKLVVVGPSTLVPSAGATPPARPTVGYVGGRDGMLHAFYIPNGGLDNNYAGPRDAAAPLNSDANGVFHTHYGSAGFSPPNALTELWAFIPPGQLPYLKSNTAEVDASPAAIDVYGDFDASGVRTWHTVLVGSAGGSNRELFALDITNPLKPVMLWDIASTPDSINLPYSSVWLSDDDTGINTGTTAVAFNWANNCHTNELATNGGTCTPAVFALPPAADAGRVLSGPYNFLHLGANQSIDIGVLRRNNAPVYTAFVPTSEPAIHAVISGSTVTLGGDGMYVFAIDLVSGQKVWEFNNPFDITGMAAARANGVGNTAPAGVGLASRATTGLVDTVYAGDDSGRLWELDAASGISLTSMNNGQQSNGCSGASCNYALSDAFGFGTTAQPISTPPVLFYLPDNLATSPALVAHKGELMLAYGTGGTDTASAINPTITGKVHVLSVAPSARILPTDLNGANFTTARADAASKGLATELGPFTTPTAGDRMFGAIQAVGGSLIFSTTQGAPQDLDHRRDLSGATYSLDLGAATPAPATLGSTTAGGAGGSPAIYYYVSGSSVGTTSPPPGATITSYKVVTVTGQGLAVATVTTGAAASSAIQNAAAKMDNVQGNKAGGNGQATFFGWFWRALGREY